MDVDLCSQYVRVPMDKCLDVDLCSQYVRVPMDVETVEAANCSYTLKCKSEDILSNILRKLK